ncbi:MAG: alpha/beta hydrolase-fold protein [Salinivirgaceae bacterium]|nr:alpha/beta hydrolase-fold protein [Salinivirgaceae bacterium]
MMRFLLFVVVIGLLSGCSSDKSQYYQENNPYKEFESFDEFRQTLDEMARVRDSKMRDSLLNLFWDSLSVNHKIPFVLDTSVCFLYRGDAKEVSWIGDFNAWNSDDKYYRGNEIRGTDLWILEKNYDNEAKFDYKVLVNKSETMVDEQNPRQHFNGMDTVSELHMPDWENTTSFIQNSDVAKGSLSEGSIIKSKVANSKYSVQYKVYLPSNYEKLQNLPVMYIIGGTDYLNEYRGNMKLVLDHMIAKELIVPIITVFIDTPNLEQQSGNEIDAKWSGDVEFVNLISNELVTYIDSKYKTSVDQSQRALLGAGAGGFAAIDIVLQKSTVFGMVAAQSPQVDVSTIRKLGKPEKLPIKFYISCGTYYDNLENVQLLRDVLIYKGYPLNYNEFKGAPTWSIWRTQLEPLLKSFYRNPV